MVGELYFLRHPVLVHLSVLIPYVALGYGRTEPTARVVTEIVWIEYNGVSKSAHSANSGILKNVKISKLDNKLLHVRILNP